MSIPPRNVSNVVLGHILPYLLQPHVSNVVLGHIVPQLVQPHAHGVHRVLFPTRQGHQYVTYVVLVPTAIPVGLGLGAHLHVTSVVLVAITINQEQVLVRCVHLELLHL
jgi:hypothetical protein